MSGEWIEWAVVQGPGFRHRVTILKGELGSREEAEAWCNAFCITRWRTDREHFMQTDGIIAHDGNIRVASRVVGAWQFEPEQQEEGA